MKFGDDTGAQLIAEGIETATELDVLRSLGVHFGQGYHLGRPAALPPPAATRHGDGARRRGARALSVS